jgi:hypothetical protein
MFQSHAHDFLKRDLTRYGRRILGIQSRRQAKQKNPRRKSESHLLRTLPDFLPPVN